MDLTRKRKADENGLAYPFTTELTNAMVSAPPTFTGALSPEDADKILEPFTKEQLLPIIRAAVLRHPDVLEAVRAVADSDPIQRKLFVRGLGWETTTEKLRQVFSDYGELDEANSIVVTDKNSGRSKGFGFVTFKHIDAAILALKESHKKIDGRMTVTQLAAAGSSGNSHSADVALRKIYVGNIPFEIPSERLLNHFSMFGEIEEGPLGFDKQSGKTKGFAFFVYKTEEGAKASLMDPMKTIDGHQLICKLATDNKKQKPNTVQQVGMVPTPGIPNSAPMAMPPQNFGMGSYKGYVQGPNMPQPPQQTGIMPHNATYNAGMAGPGGPGGQGYGTGYGSGAPAYDGVGVAGHREYSNAGAYKMPASTIGPQSSGGYADSGSYGFQSGYPPQPNHPAAPGPRIPGYMFPY